MRPPGPADSPHLPAPSSSAEELIAAIGLEPRNVHSGRHLDSPHIALVTTEEHSAREASNTTTGARGRGKAVARGLSPSRLCPEPTFTDDDPAGEHIPGAIERAVSAGVSVEDLGPVFGSLRLRYFGPRPLIEDNSVRSSPSTLVNARLGYAFGNGLRLSLEAFNLLDERASDIEYFYESRLPGETEPVEDIHFHPHEPRALRLVAEWRY